MSKSIEDPLKTWTLTSQEIEEREFLTSFNWVDSSAAWYYFEDFFALRGYYLRYNISPIGSPDDERMKPRRPDFVFEGELGNPFKPCRERNIPFVLHSTAKYLEAYEGGNDIWNIRVPRLTYAYDKYNRIVVIKAIPSPTHSCEIKNIMQLNGEPLRSLSINHTIPVLEHIVSDQGWQFLVMPAWQNWESRMKAWQVEDYLTIATQLLEGLAFMHNNGFVHGDISGSNIVFNHDKTITPDDLEPVISEYDFRVAYLDFGFSMRFDLSPDPLTWVSTSPWGTWPHIAPEKEAAATLGAFYRVLPADVYALGSVLKDMLDTEAKSISQARQAASGQSELYLSRVYANEVLKLRVPEYDEVLQKMMANDPDQRPTAEETLQLIQNIRENLPRHIRFAFPRGYPASILSSQT